MKQTDRSGVYAVASIFTDEIKWIFREQPIADHGIDGYAEVTKNDKPIGRLLALQIKSGKSFFKKNKAGNYVFYGEDRHRNYWKFYSVPVVIVLHNPEDKLTVYRRIEEDLIVDQKDGRWSIEIPPTNILNAGAIDDLEKGVSDISVLRRLNLVFDEPLIREFQKEAEIYMEVDEWPNKSLGMREARFYYGDPNGEPAHVIDRWLPTHSVGFYMAKHWPWLEWSYYDEIPEITGFDECVPHKLAVTVSEVGNAFIVMEEFYKSGVDVKEIEYEFDEEDDEESIDEQIARAVAKDPY